MPWPSEADGEEAVGLALPAPAHPVPAAPAGPDSGSTRSSRGYYTGPAKPSGTFKNGQGSSHTGGTYKNDNTQDRYQKQPKK